MSRHLFSFAFWKQGVIHIDAENEQEAKQKLLDDPKLGAEHRDMLHGGQYKCRISSVPRPSSIIITPWKPV